MREGKGGEHRGVLFRLVGTYCGSSRLQLSLSLKSQSLRSAYTLVLWSVFQDRGCKDTFDHFFLPAASSAALSLLIPR